MLLFGLYVVIGVALHSSYGVSWDEPISRSNGMVNLKHLESRYFPQLLTPEVAARPDLDDWADRDYGVAFELPLAALEQAFGISGEAVYPFRHLLTFLFCTLGVLAVYRTATFVHGDYRAGLLAAAMLVLSPRMFAESFYNSKDVVFLTAIAISTYTMTRLLSAPGWRWAALHGLATGFAIDIRVMGIVMLPLTLAFLLARLLKREVPLRSWLIATAAYLVTTLVVVVALFPFLWQDPLGNFALTFSNMSRFRWSQQVLYMGELLQATHLPWHYIPTWILLTTPPLFSVLMLAGVLRTGVDLCRNRLALWANPVQMHQLAYLALLSGPVVAIIAMRSVVYDGWRHLYFVYPAFVLVATGGAIAIWQRMQRFQTAQLAFVACLALALLCNIVWMVRAHPLQNLYFNFLAGSNWKQRFDLDYWGLANREALQAILDADKSPAITIRVVGMSTLEPSLHAFPADEAARVLLVDEAQRPRYLLTNYRRLPEGILASRFKGYAPFYERRIGEETIVSVFRIKDSATEDAISRASRPYTEEEFRQLSYTLHPPRVANGRTYVDLRITNAGERPISALTTTDAPIHVSWRFLDRHGHAAGGFEPRIRLPKDIPAHGSLSMPLQIDRRKVIPGGTLQADIVQEGRFWGQSIGVPPATLPWPMPGVSFTTRAYTRQELGRLSYSLGARREVAGATYVDFTITNIGAQRLSALTTNNTPLRVSWRFLDRDGTPTSGFDPRVSLPRDIPAHGSLVVPLRIDTEKMIAGGTLQADLVQEGLFWGHDIGLTPATHPWPAPPGQP